MAFVPPRSVSRREFLATTGAVLAASRHPFARGAALDPDVELAITARRGEVAILPGPPTAVWQYDTRLVHGPAGTVIPVPGSYLGSTIRVRTGQRIRVRFSHELPEPTIIHWHGLHVPAAADGHPRLVIPRERAFTYEFTVGNRAGTYWYHPHHHNRTGPQVHNGLAGLFLVSDEEEAALGLPSGERELVWVLQDRRFDRDNQFVYAGGMPMERMQGFLGDRVLVNGRAPDAPIELASAVYRVRLLNGSNARIYKLAWHDGMPVTAIGTDGGLLERPVTARALVLAPGERIDTLLDLRERPAGARLELRSLAFDGVEGAMGGRGMNMGGPANGAPLTILTVEVPRRASTPALRLPERLSTYDASWAPADLAQFPRKTRAIGFARMAWMFDGRTFQMEGVAPDEIVPVDTSEVWEFVNAGGMGRRGGRGRGRGGGMAGMVAAHPIHLHGAQYRVLSRAVDASGRAAWAAMGHGALDMGWKDTTLVMPGERVRFLVRFPGHTGLFLYHCHNLEHEDMGMMRNYRVDERLR